MRRPVKQKKNWLPDPIYNSIAVTRFINNLMLEGEKTKAQKVFYQALDEIKKKTNQDGFKVFQEAIKNVGPAMEVLPRRIGGATYMVPRIVRNERRFSRAVKWLISSARAKKGRQTYLNLTDELIAASKNEGAAIKKKEDVQKLAELNRAFAHFSWWGKRKTN
ncbi:MAG: 30S ribosomal protein S7 [Patescibacteria group bacterium]|nr:30S ribosomal protein S7 [Patescibacteria group bacterium]MCL5257896.1 30S ribosomal protein S7 [Patescibacteria group bacterium]